jgi:hypothetical protein
MVDMGSETNVPIIGNLVGVTLRRAEIPWEEYKKLIKKYNIPVDECVEKLKPEVALRFALMEQSKFTHGHVDGYDGDCAIFYTIRPGKNKKEFFLVKEVTGKKTDERSTTLEIKGENTYRVWLTDGGTINLACIEDGAVDQELLTTIRKRFGEFKESIPASVLVSKVKSLLKDEWRGIPYTLSRSLYFVPVAYISNVDRHKRLIQEFADTYNKYERYRTQIREIPCVDSEAQRDYVAEDVRKEIEKELRDAIKAVASTVETMVKKVTESANGGKEIDADDLRGTMVRLVERQSRLKESMDNLNNNYSELLNKEIVVNVQDIVSKEDVEEIKNRFDAIGNVVGKEAGDDFYHTALNLMGLDERAVQNLQSRFDMLDMDGDEE